MYKKGFTLVELLAVIVILSIISLITIVSVNSVIKDSKDNLSETQKKNIEKAAEAYYLKEGMNNDVSCVSVADLISKGYFDKKELKDPKDSNNITGSVNILYEGNQYSYEYQTAACSLKVECTGEIIATKESYTPGDLYNCNVSPTESHDFYILSDNMDGTVTMLMANNLKGTTTWNNRNTFLTSKTSSWTLSNNVSIPSAAQLGCSNEGLYAYCAGELASWAKPISNEERYWTSTEYNDVHAFSVGYNHPWGDTWYAEKDGEACYTNGSVVPIAPDDEICPEEDFVLDKYGIRPIITVDKTKLKK